MVTLVEAVVCATKDVVEVIDSVALAVLSVGVFVVEGPIVVCTFMVGNSVVYDASEVVGADIEVTVSAVGDSELVVELFESTVAMFDVGTTVVVSTALVVDVRVASSAAEAVVPVIGVSVGVSSAVGALVAVLCATVLGGASVMVEADVVVVGSIVFVEIAARVVGADTEVVACSEIGVAVVGITVVGAMEDTSAAFGLIVAAYSVVVDNVSLSICVVDVTVLVVASRSEGIAVSVFDIVGVISSVVISSVVVCMRSVNGSDIVACVVEVVKVEVLVGFTVVAASV
jgi:hypothetical protein